MTQLGLIGLYRMPPRDTGRLLHHYEGGGTGIATCGAQLGEMPARQVCSTNAWRDVTCGACLEVRDG